MAVLPENMDKLNVEDPRKSLSVIENYIRYMGERIEFAMRNVTKSVSNAGVSSAEMYVLITAMSNELSALKSTVNGQGGQLTSLTNSLNQLSSAISSLESSVESLQAEQQALTETVSAQTEAISSLDGRVTALENIDGGA